MKYFCRPRESGQSIVLFALLLVFLIGMIGLAVDVGNAYSQERYIQNSANAAALSGINSVTLVGKTNGEVWSNLQRTLAGNHVNNGGPEYSYWADYVLEDRSVLRLGDWNGVDAVVENPAAAPPQNIIRLQVTMQKRVETFFVRAFGMNEFTVTVNGNACLGGYTTGILSLGVPLNLQKYRLGNGNQLPDPYHRIYRPDGSELPPTDLTWGSWKNMVNHSVYLPVENWTASVPGTHVAWLSWTGSNGTPDLRAGMTYPGSLQDGFVEGPVLDASLPNTKPLKKLTRGDWVNGDTGVRSTMSSQLAALRDSKQVFGLPMYDVAGRQQGATTFHVVKIGQFRVKDFSLSGNPSFLRLEYLGDKYGAPTSCAGEPPVPPPPSKTLSIAGKTTVNQVWRSSASATTNDIVIVMDTSSSMLYDWNDRVPTAPGYQGPRLNDAKRVITTFLRGYDLEADPEARISFVTFGGSSAQSGGSPAKVVSGWSESGCTIFEITSTLCIDSRKWSTIQSATSAITANGYTPGPIAFETVEQLLQDRRSPPAGKTYRQIVLFATDGVFNVCGRTSGEQPCPYGEEVPRDGSSTDPQYYLNNPAYNMVSGRPVWQAQQVANRIKQSGASIFVVALTPRGGSFAPVGLPEMSSGTDYYYEADNGNALSRIYQKIHEKIENPTCDPRETPGQTAPNVKVRLKHPSNPNNDRVTTANGSGQWNFKDLVPGTYTIILEQPIRLRSADGLWRTYSRVVNGANPSEEDQVTVDLNPNLPTGARVRATMVLTTPKGESGAPLNGCETP